MSFDYVSQLKGFEPQLNVVNFGSKVDHNIVYNLTLGLDVLDLAPQLVSNEIPVALELM